MGLFVAFIGVFLLLCASVKAQLAYQLPVKTPSNATTGLDAAPVGVSFEFFEWPNYYTQLVSTPRCLQNLADMSGTKPRIRIGGTTQDRTTFNASGTAAVTYPSATPTAVPGSLTYSPAFFQIAADYGGLTTIGLDRRLNNIENTIAAAESAVSNMPNLDSFELGNEPDFYSSSDPIAGGSTWTPAADANSQISWISQVGSALKLGSLMKAGVFFARSATGFSVAELAPKISGSAAYPYAKVFAGHGYPQSACGGASTNLKTLMSHSSIASFAGSYKGEVTAARTAGRDYHIGETNSATCGGGGISPTFGAALWIVDYTMQALLVGVKRLYFHQGTIGNCPYCWWGRYSVGNPYWGAYFATQALASVDSIAQLDDGTTGYGTYALYDRGSATKMLLYNSDYYTSGSRPQQTWTISGLPGASVRAVRLTSSSATAVGSTGAANRGSISGLGFTDGSCALAGSETYEVMAVSCGTSTFRVSASEMLLLYLNTTTEGTC